MRNPSKVSNRLLLLARRFPFNHGEVAAESYLESEIQYLAPYFDEVVAVGTEASVSDEPTCELPANVAPVALGCGNLAFDKAMLTARGLLYPHGCDEWIEEAFVSDPVEGFRKKAFRGYFAARAAQKYEALCQELDSRGFRPTHVYSFWLYDTALVSAWVSRRYPCARAVARAHGYDLYTDRTRVRYLPFRRYLLQNLDAVLTCSKDGQAYIDKELPGFEGKVSTLYLGTRPLPDKSAEEGDGVLRVLSCSRVVDVKRVDVMAEAVGLLDRQGMSVRWTHFGDGPLMSEVKSICKGLNPSTVDFRGNCPNAALLRAYGDEHFDLFVNVSSSEGLPISIMEACGVGIPVLATDVGGTHEIVRDGENGFLLREGCNARAVADDIARFALLDSTGKKDMRRASRRIWEAGFQTEKNVGDLARVLGVETCEAGA